MHRKISSSHLLIFLAVFDFTAAAQDFKQSKKPNEFSAPDSSAAIITQNTRRNEKNVIATLRAVVAAQATYQATIGNGNYGTFANLATAGLIEEDLVAGNKHGYVFVLTANNGTPPMPSRFTVTAVPNLYLKSGRRSFFTNETGMIRGLDNRGLPIGASAPPIEEEYVCDSIAECEAAAISSLRTLHGAEATYQATIGNGNFGSLCQLGAENLLDQFLTAGSRYGYYFVAFIKPRTTTSDAGFEIRAIPHRYGTTGLRSFFVDESGVIRAADRQGALANADDPPISN